MQQLELQHLLRLRANLLSFFISSFMGDFWTCGYDLESFLVSKLRLVLIRVCVCCTDCICYYFTSSCNQTNLSVLVSIF